MNFRLATFEDQSGIWEIIKQAIARRKAEGSQQWQKGYPNENSIHDDIEKGHGYVIEENGSLIAYSAVIFGIDPAYKDIKGKWLTEGDYVVMHRIATPDCVKGRGIGTLLFQKVEELAKSRNVFSIKVDTNFDNGAMLHILEKLHYKHCGEVMMRGEPRLAFEKVLN